MAVFACRSALSRGSTLWPPALAPTVGVTTFAESAIDVDRARGRRVILAFGKGRLLALRQYQFTRTFVRDESLVGP